MVFVVAAEVLLPLPVALGHLVVFLVIQHVLVIQLHTGKHLIKNFICLLLVLGISVLTVEGQSMLDIL